MKYDEFLKKVLKEEVYLRYQFEDAVLHFIPHDGDVKVFVKFKKEKEFEAKKGSGLVLDAELQVPLDIITKEVYDKW